VSVKSVNHNLKNHSKKTLHYNDCTVFFHRGADGCLVAQVPGSFHGGGERMKPCSELTNIVSLLKAIMITNE